MGERGGLPIKEIPALVLDVARAQGWLDPREAESLRSALSAARKAASESVADAASADQARFHAETALAAAVEERDIVTARCAVAERALDISESSARRLRETVAAYAKSCRAFVEPSPGSYLRGRYDASLAVADELDAIVARAALGSSPVDTKGETT